MRKIKNNLVFFIISCVVALMPTLVGVIFWNQLPSELVTHYAFDGTPDGISSKVFTVFFVGLYMLGIHLFCSIITAMDKKDGRDGISDKVYKLCLCLCPAMSVFVSVVFYFPVLGYSLDVGFWAQIFIGLLYIVLGNYMPKARQNHFFGTRIKWTLESKKNWDHTHRFTGWILCILGAIFILSAVTGFMNALGEVLGMTFFIGINILFTFLSVGYSYVYKVNHEKEEDYYDK